MTIAIGRADRVVQHRQQASSRLRVIVLSDAFKSFWNDLAADLDAIIDAVEGAADTTAPMPETAAVILAAGGAEAEAVRWLDSHATLPDVPVLVVGTDPGRRTAMQLTAHGASDYFALPDDLEIFRNRVAAALRGGRAHATGPSRSPGDPFAGIVGESPALKRDLERAARFLSHRNATALILGETGTGKELLARAIHTGGPRSGAPFVAVNCSALPEHLIESELFGHERGAFTGADAAKPGLFEIAEGGSLFLDEVGDLPLGLQAKLLRVLDDRQVRRVGGTKTRTLDVRIIAATNEPLRQRVAEKTFREDLYFRLSTVVLTLPPLRERGNDVILVAESLIQRFVADHKMRAPSISDEARSRLLSHAWPGNIRELKNAVERALLLSRDGELNVEELLPLPEPLESSSAEIPFPASLREIDVAAAGSMVRLCRGNRSAAARRLGISTRRLRHLLDGEPAVEAASPSRPAALPH